MPPIPGPEPDECCPKEVTPLLRCLSETFAEFGLSILPASSGQPLKKEWESSPQPGVSPQQPDQTPSSGCISGPGLRRGADTARTQPRASPGPEGREGAGRVARRPARRRRKPQRSCSKAEARSKGTQRNIRTTDEKG